MCRWLSLFLLAVIPSVASRRRDASAKVFSDHMVLQQGIKLPIWGKAAPGREVISRFLDQKKSVKAGEDGRWLSPPRSAQGGGPHELTVAGKNTLAQDVLVGEVWVCSGQSNMWWPLSPLPRLQGARGSGKPVASPVHRGESAVENATGRSRGRPVGGMRSQHRRHLLGGCLLLWP